MATTYSTRAKLAKPGTADRLWNVPINANADTLDAVNAVGGLAVTLTETPSTTLNVAVAAGFYVKQDGSTGTYAGTASQAITTATTKYLYLDAAGALVVGASYPTTAHVRLAVVVAGSTTISSITDGRVTAAEQGTFAARNFTFDTTTGSKFGTATTEKIGFYNATPIVQRSGADQAAVATTGASNSTPYGFTTAAQANALVALANELRATLVALGLFKGSA